MTFNCFEDAGLTQTQSSVKGKTPLRRQMDVWSLDLWTLQKINKIGKQQQLAKEKTAGGIRGVRENLRFPLDYTYHGFQTCSDDIQKCRSLV